MTEHKYTIKTSGIESNHHIYNQHTLQRLPGGSDGKESACNAEDLGSIPGLGISPGDGHGNPLQYFCLENPVDRETWQATIHSVSESDTIE